LPLPGSLPDACTYDETSLPLPVPPLDASLSCTPNPARGVTCEPRLFVRIPVKLGPRTKLYDLAFTGARSIEEKKLAVAADLTLGQPANALKLDEARRREREQRSRSTRESASSSSASSFAGTT
jgi:hypothetical protein